MFFINFAKNLSISWQEIWILLNKEALEPDGIEAIVFL